MKTHCPESQIGIFRETCRRNGLKVTPQRESIYRVLHDSTIHPSADQIFGEVRRQLPGVTLDTVHRTLAAFTRIGLARMVEGFANPRRYDPNLAEHHHLHCLKCGLIVDFTSRAFDRLRVPADAASGYDILSARVVLAGVCPKCQQKQKSGKSIALRKGKRHEQD